MQGELTSADSAPIHGATRLASVTVDTYNADLRDAEGFVGDRASKRASTRFLMRGAAAFVRLERPARGHWSRRLTHRPAN